jgi:integrase
MACAVLGADTTPSDPDLNDMPAKPTRERRDRPATTKEVEAWIAAGGPKRHCCGNHLWLQVVHKEAASWFVRYPWAGKQDTLGLGKTWVTDRKHGLTLKQARGAADDALALLRQGKNPKAEKQEKRAAQREAAAAAKAAASIKQRTFRTVAHDVIADRAKTGTWRDARAEATWWNSLARYAFPFVGDLDVAEITTKHIKDILTQPLKDDAGNVLKDKTGRPLNLWRDQPETAGRVRGRLEVVLGAARVMGYRTGENPARWKENLDHLLPALSKVQVIRHHPSAPWTQVPDVMKALAGKPGQSARALRFAILCASRSGEVRHGTWGEVDLTAKLWVIPAGRMKIGKEHRVPLTDPAIQVLLEARGDREPAPTDLIFPSSKNTPLSDMALLELVRGLDLRDPRTPDPREPPDLRGAVCTAHGFRSSFRDWAAESGQPHDLAEAALAHVAGDRVVRSYLRSDVLQRRAAMMAAWAAVCCPGDDAARPSLLASQRAAQ